MQLLASEKNSVKGVESHLRVLKICFLLYVSYREIL